MDIYKYDALKKAYELLENTTPLDFDCGSLCHGICCKGSECDGMLLFPGEERLFENRQNNKVYFDKKYEMYAVSCKGECERNNRPLACRIFPYMFYVSEKNSITVAPDLRATEICPILYDSIDVTQDFMRKMRMIAKLFETDETVKEYLKKLTETLTDLGNF